MRQPTELVVRVGFWVKRFFSCNIYLSLTDNFRKDGNAEVLEEAFFGAGLKRIRFI